LPYLYPYFKYQSSPIYRFSKTTHDGDYLVAEESFLGSREEHEDIEDIEGLGDVNFAVRLQNVSRIYKIGSREITALSNVSLDITPSEFIVVSGHSGSGKTTLLNLIGCIDYATSGRVFVLDVPIEDYDESFRATFRLANTGFIFQSYNLISTLTALENIMFPMQLSDIDEVELNARAMKLLTRVGLEDRADHLPWQLSSGEQQRVAIARAMANDPSIILADEPTANLDAENADMVRMLLRDLHSEGKTLIVMTHDDNIISSPKAKSFTMLKGVLNTNE
jgi:putative ABC transport system ATP-binding protein